MLEELGENKRKLFLFGVYELKKCGDSWKLLLTYFLSFFLMFF
jgi:hypothetical protein